MKISLTQLDMVLSKMKYEMLGYHSDSKDLAISIAFTQEDPGIGSMVDCLTITATVPSEKEGEGDTSMTVELYPEQDKIEPRASKTKSFSIKSKY